MQEKYLSEIYLPIIKRRLASLRAKDQTAQLSDFMTEAVVPCSDPSLIPSATWEKLTLPQRTRKLLSRAEGQLASLRIDSIDLLAMCYPDLNITDQQAETACYLLAETYRNRNNPTLRPLIETIQYAYQAEQPLELVVSQCIGKTAAVRTGKLNYFLGRDRNLIDLEQFSSYVLKKGWGKLRDLASSSNYPLRISLVLGDQDYYTLDGCRFWCSADSLKQLRMEVQVLKEKTTKEAQEFFADNDVQVKLWSEIYPIEQFDQELERAKRIGIRQNDDNFIDGTIKMYLDQWGYRGLARSLEIDQEKLRDFIYQDMLRTAAQYRLEANYVIARQATIQGWAEDVPKPFWPVEISNYDSTGYAPSLLLT